MIRTPPRFRILYLRDLGLVEVRLFGRVRIFNGPSSWFYLLKRRLARLKAVPLKKKEKIHEPC